MLSVRLENAKEPVNLFPSAIFIGTRGRYTHAHSLCVFLHQSRLNIFFKIQKGLSRLSRTKIDHRLTSPLSVQNHCDWWWRLLLPGLFLPLDCVSWLSPLCVCVCEQWWTLSAAHLFTTDACQRVNYTEWRIKKEQSTAKTGFSETMGRERERERRQIDDDQLKRAYVVN